MHSASETSSVPLCLGKSFLRTEGDSLGFDNSDYATLYKQSIVGRPVRCWVLSRSEGTTSLRRSRESEGNNRPARRTQSRVNQAFACLPFRLLDTVSHCYPPSYLPMHRVSVEQCQTLILATCTTGSIACRFTHPAVQVQCQQANHAVLQSDWLVRSAREHVSASPITRDEFAS